MRKIFKVGVLLLSLSITSSCMSPNVSTSPKPSTSVKPEVSIKVSSRELDLKVGDTNNIIIEVLNLKDKDNKVSLISENNNIAIVNDQGLVTAISAGDTNIRITVDSKPKTKVFVKVRVSALPTPTIETEIYDIASRESFDGVVYDVHGNKMDDVIVKVKSVDPNVVWVGESQKTIKGKYSFKRVPVGARLEITASKEGYGSKTRTEVLKSNISPSSDNKFDFDWIFALQEEPLVESVKINGIIVSKHGQATIAKKNDDQVKIEAEQKFIDYSYYSDTTKVITDSEFENLRPSRKNEVGVSGVDANNINIEMTFSNPVDKASVENNFCIFSEFHHTNPILFNRVKKDEAFEIDNKTHYVKWSWSEDGKTATFQINKPILVANDDNEMRYTATFVKPFQDISNKKALKRHEVGNNKGGYFKFSEAVQHDFFTFSVKADKIDPKILSISAIDNTLSKKDIIILNFNKRMDAIGYNSSLVNLDPIQNQTGETLKSNFYQLNNNVGNETPSYVATQLGYNSKVGELSKIIYSITRLDENGRNPKALNIKTKPTAKLDDTGKILTLEFENTAFEKGDKILVKIGNNFDGDLGIRYLDLNDNLRDPSGNTFSDSNNTVIDNVYINDSQKLVTVEK